MKIESSDPNFPPGLIKLATHFKDTQEMFRTGVDVEQPAIPKTLGGVAMIAAGGMLNLVGRAQDSRWTRGAGIVTAVAGAALMARGIDELIVGDTLQSGASEIFVGMSLGTVQVLPEAGESIHLL